MCGGMVLGFWCLCWVAPKGEHLVPLIETKKDTPKTTPTWLLDCPKVLWITYKTDLNSSKKAKSLWAFCTTLRVSFLIRSGQKEMSPMRSPVQSALASPFATQTRVTLTISDWAVHLCLKARADPSSAVRGWKLAEMEGSRGCLWCVFLALKA